MYKFCEIPIKIPMTIFIETKENPKICMEPQKTLDKGILRGRGKRKAHSLITNYTKKL